MISLQMPGRLVLVVIAMFITGCGGSDTAVEPEAVAEPPKYSAAVFFATTSYGLVGRRLRVLTGQHEVTHQFR